MKHTFRWAVALLLLNACQAEQVPTGQLQPDSSQPLAQSLRVSTEASTTAPRRSYPAIEKHAASGQISLNGQQLTLSLELYPKANPDDFQTQLLDLSTATKLQATVTDSHGKTYTATGADGNVVDYTGGTITLVFENVIPDPLLFVEVQAKAGTTNIVQADLATVIKHTVSTSPVNTTINFQTTPAAKAIKALLAVNANRARAINLIDLAAKMVTITGVTGTAPVLAYTTHPTLVNTAQMALDLVTTDASALNPVTYRQIGATINLTVSGLLGADKLQVQSTDAASAIKTNLSNGVYTITGATPGSLIAIKAQAFGTPSAGYNYMSIPTGLILTEGASTDLTIFAVPTFFISSFTPTQGAAGTSVVITGAGFTGTTAVNFNGTSALYTVDNTNQITATVPAGATDGPITVVNGSSFNSNANFNVFRRIYVDSTPSSTGNNGSSWANAYSSLQTALSAAAANDEIWIAAGKYTPHASDRNVSFVMKENLKIYGGFAGTETVLSDRTATVADFVTVLSGDLNGDDTSGGDNTENAYHVLKGVNNAELEGVTIQGGNANGVSPDENKGGGIFNRFASPSLSNVTFSKNSASYGAGLYNDTSHPVLTNVAFSENSASFGGGVYNFASNPNLKSVTFSKNSATNGGGMNNTGSSPSLKNVTFSDNSATANGSGIYNSNASSPLLQNVLFWKSTRYDPSANAGNAAVIEVADANDPFVNSAQPKGVDGIARTADDGLRIKASAGDVINKGVPISGVADPLLDILGLARVGRPEPGAYEFISSPLPVNVIAVDKNATGANNGSTWTDAYTDLQTALVAAPAGTEIWIAGGGL